MLLFFPLICRVRLGAAVLFVTASACTGADRAPSESPSESTNPAVSASGRDEDSLLSTEPPLAAGVEPPPEILVVEPDPEVTIDGIGHLARGCPSVWPERVDSVFATERTWPTEAGCRSVTADFNGDGRTDAVVTASTDEGEMYVLVLDGERPSLTHIAPSNRGTGLVYVPAGQHFIPGCFDPPYSGDLDFENPAFNVVNYFSQYYYMDGDSLVSRPGSQC